MTIKVKVKENKKHHIMFSVGHGKFSEGKIKGEVIIGVNGGLMFNLSDGRQFMVTPKDVCRGLIDVLKTIS